MEDNLLIYQYQVEFQEVVVNFLWNKYLFLIKQITWFVFKKFRYIPLEIDDLLSIQYFSFVSSLKIYRLTSNKSFLNYMQQKLKWDILQYIKKFINKNQAILNYASSYESVQDWLLFPCNDSLKVKEREYVNYKFAFLTKRENDVLNLKMKGYSNNDIAIKLKTTYKSVDNAYQRARIKLKENKSWKKD